MNRYPGNYMDSGIVTLPRQLKTRPGAPQTHLAYITGDEAQMLQQNKPGTPHTGPHGIPNYDSWDIDESGKASFTSGAEASAREARDNRGDKSQDKKDYSYSTRDVRSSVHDRQEFRDRTGSKVMTDSENLARGMYKLTGNQKYLSMPIFVPQNVDWGKIQEAYNQALQTGNKEIFFNAVGGLSDITTGNPNIDQQLGFGTSHDDWYRVPGSNIGGGGPGGGGRWYNQGVGSFNPGAMGGQRFMGPRTTAWGINRGRFGTDEVRQSVAALQGANTQPINQSMFANQMWQSGSGSSLPQVNRGGIMSLRR
jgi:hypothetical protein